jgi:hypothetical protein
VGPQHAASISEVLQVDKVPISYWRH